MRTRAGLIFAGLAGLLIGGGVAGLRAASPASAPAVRLLPEQVTRSSTRVALDNAVRFLIGSQNPDGSWGGAADSITTWSGWTWTNPESHRAWRVATTGLCCLALLEVAGEDGQFTPVDRGLDYLIANADVRRPSDWDTMECWAHIYGLQALAAAWAHPHYAGSPRHEDIRRAAIVTLEHLAYTQSLSGGWGYLEFAAPRTARPQWATSFTTAAGVVALVEARNAGLPVDDAMLQRAARAVRRCRLPNGAYTYSVQAITHPRRIGSIDRINGSLGRIQVGNIALLMAGHDVPVEMLRTGLDHFFREHRFLDIAMHKPVPHEAYYQNSGYFYLFGHYYAARVIEHLPPEERRTAWPRLLYEVMKIQQADGSMWDYDMHAYDKPYGTAYGVMVLQRGLRDSAPDAPGALSSAPPAPASAPAAGSGRQQ